MVHETEGDSVATYRLLLAHSGGDELSALVDRAVSHARRMEWSEAEACLLRVLKRVPDAGQVRAYLGSVRLELGRVDEARADIAAALEMAPSNALVRLKQAEMFLRLGLPSQAYTELQHAAKLRQPDATTFEYIGALQATLKNVQPLPVERRNASLAEFWRGLIARFQSKRPAIARSQAT